MMLVDFSRLFLQKTCESYYLFIVVFIYCEWNFFIKLSSYEIILSDSCLFVGILEYLLFFNLGLEVL